MNNFKKCTKCKEFMHIDFFHKQGNGKKPSCRLCSSEYAKIKRKENAHIVTIKNKENWAKLSYEEKKRRNSNKKRVLVYCISCSTEINKRKDSISKWNGNCINCARKEVANRPETKEMMRGNARNQVIKQGGIKNGNRFTSEHSGEKHWNWQGGITPFRVKIWNSKEYQEWRNEVFKRDSYKCVACGINDHKLEADHIKSFSLHEELRYCIDNGRTLCKKCHKKYGAWSNKGVLYREASFDYESTGQTG